MKVEIEVLESAQRLAFAAGWESQPTKRKNAFAWTPPFCPAHHQVRCIIPVIVRDAVLARITFA